MRRMTGLFMALVLAVGTPTLMGQGNAKWKRAQSDDAERDAQNYGNDHRSVSVNVSIGRTDERIIREWFSQPSNLKGLPPGLAKRDQLPPGLQKHLARNGQLPPGLEKRIQPLPPTLEARLTPLPEGRKRIILNGSIILLDQKKNLILDMIAVF